MNNLLESPLKRLSLAALVGGLALPLLASAGQGDTTGKEAQKPEAETRAYWRAQTGRPAPPFELTDLAGQSWKLADQRGKIVVLEWFNPDCPVVRAAHGEGGTLRGVGNRMDGADDVVWVAINSGAPGEQGHGAERNAQAKKDFALSYPLLLDEAGWVGRMYGATTTPHMFVIDAAGKLAYAGGHGKGEGAHPVITAVEDLRAGRAVATPGAPNFGCNVKYPTKAAVGLVAPLFTLEDTEGKGHALADHLGKPVVIEWFNPDCPAVKRAYAQGATLDGYAATVTGRGVSWLAINSGGVGQQGHGVERNQRARQDWKLANPVLLDESGTTGRAYGATTTPHMFVVDARGVLVYVGGHDDQKGRNFIEETVTDLLEGKAVRQPKTKNYG